MRDPLLLTIRISGTFVLKALVKTWSLDTEGRLTFRAVDLWEGERVFDETRTLAAFFGPALRQRLGAGAGIPVTIWFMGESRWQLSLDLETEELLLSDELGVALRAEAAPLSLLIGETSLRALEARQSAA